MLRDMESHPIPNLFKLWATKRGACPYNGEIERLHFFNERAKLFNTKAKRIKTRDLIIMIAKYKNWSIKTKF